MFKSEKHKSILTSARTHERLFPNQTFNKFLSDLPEPEYEEKIFEFIISNSETGIPFNEFIEADTDAGEALASSPIGIAVLKLLISIMKPKSIVEIGTYIGYSTVNMALSLEDGGKIVAIEFVEDFYSTCQKNLERFNVNDRVTLLLGDAKTTLQKIRSQLFSTDLVFIDGDKEHYLDYIDFFKDCLSEGGVIIVDDCFFHGDILEEYPKTEKGAGLVKVWEQIKVAQHFTPTILPIGNGILILTKKRAG